MDTTCNFTISLKRPNTLALAATGSSKKDVEKKQEVSQDTVFRLKNFDRNDSEAVRNVSVGDESVVTTVLKKHNVNLKHEDVTNTRSGNQKIATAAVLRRPSHSTKTCTAEPSSNDSTDAVFMIKKPPMCRQQSTEKRATSRLIVDSPESSTKNIECFKPDAGKIVESNAAVVTLKRPQEKSFPAVLTQGKVPESVTDADSEHVVKPAVNSNEKVLARSGSESVDSYNVQRSTSSQAIRNVPSRAPEKNICLENTNAAGN